MPLPCSPVSTSAGDDTSASQSQSAAGSDSEGSLITPRPGPSAPDQRTQATLSKPVKPTAEAFQRSTSFKNWRTDTTRERAGAVSEDDEFEQAVESGHAIRDLSTTSNTHSAQSTSVIPNSAVSAVTQQRLSIITTVASIEPRQTSSPAPSVKSHRSGSSSSARRKSKSKSRSGSGSTSPTLFKRPVEPERQRSVSFHPSPSLNRPTLALGGISPNTSFNAYTMSRKGSPRTSALVAPHLTEEPESSADENTAILRRASARTSGAAVTNYGGTSGPGGDDAEPHAEGYEAIPDSSAPIRRKVGSPSQAPASGPSQHSDASSLQQHERWWHSLFERYGSIELENKGSVARDHLALERTFLAWLRTSLSFASIGIAVTQLFRLNTTLQRDPNGDGTAAAAVMVSSGGGATHESPLLSALASSPDLRRLSSMGKPLGATFLAVAILILFVGFHRYFESQHYVIKGKFPASRGSVLLVSAVAGALIVASLVVILSVAPRSG